MAELPERVVASAITVDPDTGLGLLLEEVAGLTQLSQGAMERPDSQLVQAVFAEYKAEGEGEARSLQLSQQGIENLVPETLQMARQVAEMLATRCAPTEVAAFTSWLLDAAESACSAAGTGGILGIGGKKISDAEAEFLVELGEAFGTVNAEERA